MFREAAQRGVAIEIDGNWHRQDMDYELAAVALDEGCLFALDSDAHSIAELPFTDYAIAHARIAGIPADRVVNCWEEAKFDAWLSERRRPRAHGLGTKITNDPKVHERNDPKESFSVVFVIFVLRPWRVARFLCCGVARCQRMPDLAAR